MRFSGDLVLDFDSIGIMLEAIMSSKVEHVFFVDINETTETLLNIGLRN